MLPTSAQDRRPPRVLSSGRASASGRRLTRPAPGPVAAATYSDGADKVIDADHPWVAERGTTGVSDAVRLALQQAAAAAARARQVEWLSTGGMAELTDPDERSAVWR